MKKHSFLLSIILLLISCSKTKKTDIGAVYFSDKNCLEKIENAKRDFTKNKKYYFLFWGYGEAIDDNDKIISNLRKEGINAKTVTTSCIVMEQLRQNCYEKEMNFLIEKEIGKEKLQEIIFKAKKEYVDVNHLKIKTFPEGRIIDSLENKIKIRYPKEYSFSKNIKDVSYFRQVFEIKSGKLDLSEYVETVNETGSNEYLKNRILDGDLRLQIKSYLKNELPKLNLVDGTYFILIKLE